MTDSSRPNPPYRADDLDPAYQLRFTWTGWPKGDGQFPDEPSAPFFDELTDSWEADGLRLLERWWDHDEIHLLISTEPDVAPQLMAKRLKGRLQHALRQKNTPTDFSRNFCLKSVGDAKREAVEPYIESQVTEENFADPEFEAKMEDFSILREEIDLSDPVETNHGRYLYSLHLVFVVEDRFHITNTRRLAGLRDLAEAVADKKDHRLSRLAVVPDHLHLSVGAPPDQSPEEAALGYMNNLAHGIGHRVLWQPSYYAGTFGEYDMGALRQNL